MVLRYTGFSTKNKMAINHVLTGDALVIEDLMNEIMTRKGERIMLPNYGSIIHDMIFEPLTENTKELIMDDLRTIIENDPRCMLLSIVVSETDHALTARIKINLIPSNEITELVIDLERE
jgi:phage baseplate assembly protein W